MRVAVLLALVLAAAAALGVIVDHAGEDVYYVPGYAVGIAVAAFAATVGGAVAVWRSRQALVGVAMAIAAALAVGGLLAILSIGLLLLIASVPFAAYAAARCQNENALGGGALLGIGLPVLAVIALSQPLVDCESGRAGENVFLGLESDSGTSSMSSSPDGDTSGSFAGDGYAYEYECRDGKLVRFEMD
jgi:hypothetical protein